jgi:hypothetical protein
MRLVAIGLALLAGACDMKPAPFPTPDSELGPRPGLLSGPTGELTICCTGSVFSPPPAPAPSSATPR